MKRLEISWACLALLAGLTGGARAGELERARALYDEMEYDAALAAAGRVLEEPEAGPAELVEAYRLQGLCFSVLDREEEALAAFHHMLSIAPDSQLPADTSPKLAAPFYQAVAMARDVRPIALGLAGAGPRHAGAGPVLVRLESDPFGLVKSVRLVTRAGGAAWQRAPAQDIAGSGQAELHMPAPTPGVALEYFVEALTAAGGVVHRLGGPDRPYRLAAAAPVADRVAEDASLREEDDRDAAAPWYQAWWFWTAVGVVVAGTAVGLGVGLGLDSGGSDSGPRDYIISFP